LKEVPGAAPPEELKVTELATEPACPVVFWLSVGTSAATIARKPGVPDTPSGEAKTKLADCDAHAAASVPDEVTGEPETTKSAGKDKPTEVTVPVPTIPDQINCEPVHCK
jgi:hypothetical protein